MYHRTGGEGPDVSIIVPAKNAERFIRTCLSSVATDDADITTELILVDHASTDGTLDQTYGIHIDRRLMAEDGGGPSRPKNVGLKHAKGRYVTFLDADDVLPIGSLYRRFAFLEEHPEIDAVFGRLTPIDARCEPFQGDVQFALWTEKSYAYAKSVPHLSAKDIAEGRLAGYPTLMYRQSAIGEELFDESLSRGEDFDFVYRLATAGKKVAFLDAPCLKYRVHDTNTSIRIVDGRIEARPETRVAHFAALRKHGLI